MTNAIQRAEQPQQAMTVAEQMKYADVICKGSLVPQAYRGNAANVLIAMDFGRSMGLSPAESLYRITVINGKPTASAELIAANVRRAGHRLRVRKDEKARSATVEIIRADDPDYTFSATWDMAKAQQAGLSGKDNWKKYPLAMLTARAITECARDACPEALYGVAYTGEELGGDLPQQASQQPQELYSVEVVDGAPQQDVPEAEQPEQPEPALDLAQKRLGDAMRRAKGVGFDMAEIKIGAVEMYGKPITELTVKQTVEYTEAVNSMVDGYVKGQQA